MRLLCSVSTVFLLSLCSLSCSSNQNKSSLSDETEKVSTPKGNTISLAWKPNVFQDDFKVEALDMLDIDICFKTITDSRESKESIGTINLGGQNVAVATENDIGNWFEKNIITTCRFLGLKSVGKTGAYSFEGEITSFSILQDVTLHGKIGLSLSFNKDGLTVWEGSVEGNTELYLIPAGSDGVSECMSNTLVSTVYNLLNDKSFVDAVNKSKE